MTKWGSICLCVFEVATSSLEKLRNGTKKLWACVWACFCVQHSVCVHVHMNNELLVYRLFSAFAWAKQTEQNDIWPLEVMKLITSARQPHWPSGFAPIRSVFTTLFFRIKQHKLLMRRDTQSCNTYWSHPNTWTCQLQVALCLWAKRYSHETQEKSLLKWDDGSQTCK